MERKDVWLLLLLLLLVVATAAVVAVGDDDILSVVVMVVVLSCNEYCYETPGCRMTGGAVGWCVCVCEVYVVG